MVGRWIEGNIYSSILIAMIVAACHVFQVLRVLLEWWVLANYNFKSVSFTNMLSLAKLSMGILGIIQASSALVLGLSRRLCCPNFGMISYGVAWLAMWSQNHGMVYLDRIRKSVSGRVLFCLDLRGKLRMRFSICLSVVVLWWVEHVFEVLSLWVPSCSTVDTSVNCRYGIVVLLWHLHSGGHSLVLREGGDVWSLQVMRVVIDHLILTQGWDHVHCFPLFSLVGCHVDVWGVSNSHLFRRLIIGVVDH